jgi:glucan 1,3-beta-glucosidase
VRHSLCSSPHRHLTERKRNRPVQGEHEAYWSQYPGSYEHWRFKEGFIQGWDDAYAFFASAGGPVLPELGYKGAWSKIRERSHVEIRGNGSCVWEYSEKRLVGSNYQPLY